MLTRPLQNILIAVAALSILLGASAARQAHAVVIFNFIATCDSCPSPLVPNSPVTGKLVLQDSILDGMGNIPQGGTFDSSEIVSLELTFELDMAPFTLTSVFTPPILPFPGQMDPVGLFNLTGTGIEAIQVSDSSSPAASLFFVGAISEGQPAIWVLIDIPGGSGEVISFDPPPTNVAEPSSAIIFGLALIGLMVVSRRQSSGALLLSNGRT